MTTVNNGKLELPSSGYEIIEKILHAYALSGDKPIALDDVASRAGMSKTHLSSNHPYNVPQKLDTALRWFPLW